MPRLRPVPGGGAIRLETRVDFETRKRLWLQHSQLAGAYAEGVALGLINDHPGHAWTECPACGQRTEIIGYVRPLNHPDSLDAAWAEAEAVLPEGWEMGISGEPGDSWIAEAAVQLGKNGGDELAAVAPTATAALRDLATKLRSHATPG